jgi:hypothetical protein
MLVALPKCAISWHARLPGDFNLRDSWSGGAAILNQLAARQVLAPFGIFALPAAIGNCQAIFVSIFMSRISSQVPARQ